MSSTRRNILAALLASPVLAMIGINRTAAQPNFGLDLTHDCHDGDDHTVAQTEGPYFKPNAPLKQNLVADAPRGEKMTIGGFVIDTACRPLPKTIVQVWHADETGAYDTAGYRLRGYQFTDRDGRWRFSTIVPAEVVPVV
jgi:protocatechuate 3,4-dioxygenase beta subunit